MDNIYWHNVSINKEKREKLLNQKGVILWLTGISGSGKSTIASLLEEKLHSLNYLTYHLDGDNLRFGLNKDLSFSDEDRLENIRRVSEVSNILLQGGFIVICTFISPFRSQREELKKKFNEDFKEIYIKCSLEEAKRRDVKGLYKKALNGEINNFTSLESVYEAPLNPNFIINTEIEDLNNSLEKLLNFVLKEVNYENRKP